MIDLVGLIKDIVRKEMGAAPPSAFGTVAAIHLPDAAGTTQYACDVTLQGTDATLEKVPLLTPYLGQQVAPAVGDVVVLAYVGGDPDAPVITGFAFSEAVPPQEIAAGERLIRLPHDGADGDRIDMRQTAGTGGSRAWSVTLPDGPELKITDAALTATVGDFVLTIDSDGGEASLTAGGATLTLAGSGEVTLNCDGDMTFESAGNLTLKAGASVEIEAGATMALKGAKIDLN